MTNKIIYVDCDGVLLDWVFASAVQFETDGFPTIDDSIYDMGQRLGIPRKEALALIYQFNQSAQIGFLPPYMNAIKYVKKLHEEEGFVFHVITSLGSNPYAIVLREQNLRNFFGSAIIAIECLDLGVSKEDHLKRIPEHLRADTWWIEDYPTNALEGFNLGMKTILMNSSYNQQADAYYRGNPSKNILRAKDWQDVYNIITGN